MCFSSRNCLAELSARLLVYWLCVCVCVCVCECVCVGGGMRTGKWPHILFFRWLLLPGGFYVLRHLTFPFEVVLLVDVSAAKHVSTVTELDLIFFFFFANFLWFGTLFFLNWFFLVLYRLHPVSRLPILTQSVKSPILVRCCSGCPYSAVPLRRLLCPGVLCLVTGMCSIVASCWFTVAFSCYIRLFFLVNYSNTSGFDGKWWWYLRVSSVVVSHTHYSPCLGLSRYLWSGLFSQAYIWHMCRAFFNN